MLISYLLYLSNFDKALFGNLQGQIENKAYIYSIIFLIKYLRQFFYNTHIAKMQNEPVN